jgi:glycine hydroxymethyltransferase
MTNLQSQDPEVFSIIEREKKRQKEGLEMIPSENYASAAALEAAGSILNDKYAEGYPGRRYYSGNIHIDEVERLAQARALKAFSAEGYHVNVQPYSGSPANLAVYLGLLKPGDTIMSLRLDQGGHLTHGSPVNASGKLFNFVFYPLDAEKEMLDYDVIQKLAETAKPKLILSGFTAYPRKVDFERMAAIAKSVGAISMADISHISGLVIGGVHPSPFPSMDVVTTTTHKTLRGPRGAMIFCKEELREKIDKAVFPGMQGGPHEHTIAGIAVTLGEALRPEFKEYAAQVVKNASVLATTLIKEGLKLVSGGTETHLMLIDLRPFGVGRGVFVTKALEAAEINVNFTTVPNEPSVPLYPSGIRLGTPALTTRGMREKEMEVIGTWIAEITKACAATVLPEEKEKRAQAVKDFAATLEKHEVVKKIRARVVALASKFPVPGIDS